MNFNNKFGVSRNFEKEKMRDFGLRFIFRGTAGHRLGQTELYEIHREVSRILELSGFGDAIENEGVFRNRYLAPAIDAFDEEIDELHISYYVNFPIPRGQGDIWLLHSRYIPELHGWVENQGLFLRFHTILI